MYSIGKSPLRNVGELKSEVIPMFTAEAQKRHKEEIVAWLTAYAEREGLTMSELTFILEEFQHNLPLLCVVKNPKTR